MISVGIAQIPNSISVDDNFNAIKMSLNRFEKSDADLILFPECSLSGFTAKMKDCTLDFLDPFLNEIQDWVMKNKVEVVLPTAFVVDGRVYNSGFWFNLEGRQQFYKLGLTESEKKFFATPQVESSKVFQVKDYKFGILICYEAEHQPWLYFNKGEVDVILWPGYWGWTSEITWEQKRDNEKLNPIFQNVIDWKCPLLQSNFSKNNLEGHNGSGPEGLSFIINSDNKLVYKGAHLADNCFIVRLNKENDKTNIIECQSIL